MRKFINLFINLSKIEAFYIYTGLSVLYLLLVFVLPANTETLDTYNLSATAYHVIMFAAAIPTLIIWLTAFYAATELGRYAKQVRSSKEGKYFIRMAQGVGLLAWSLPIMSIIALIFSSIANVNDGFDKFSVIASNYIYVYLPLAAFTILNTGSHGLLKHVRVFDNLFVSKIFGLGFIITAATYCMLLFQQVDLDHAGSIDNPYYLPAWILLFTLTIPMIYSWFLGALSAYEIAIYSYKVKGVFYKKAFLYLAFGIFAVVFSLIAQQYITSIQPRVGHLVVNYALIANIIFRLIGAVGFIMLAVGASKLRRLEEL